MGIHYNPSKKCILLTKFIYYIPCCVYYTYDYFSQVYIDANKITPYYIYKDRYLRYKIKIPAMSVAGIFILYANNMLIIRYYNFAMIASTAALRPSGFLPPAVAKWG